MFIGECLTFGIFVQYEFTSNSLVTYTRGRDLIKAHESKLNQVQS